MNPIRAFRNWRMYNQTVRELNRLNARQLNDLGINRADIETIARQGRFPTSQSRTRRVSRRRFRTRWTLSGGFCFSGAGNNQFGYNGNPRLTAVSSMAF